MKKIVVVMVAGLLMLSGCTQDKKVYELIAKLEKRIEALEKIVLPQEPEAQKQAYDISKEDSPVFGDEKAPVSIIVFSNFQCPYCSRADKKLREVVSDNELKGKVNLIFKHFPFERHPEAKPAAKAAMAAQEQGKFWEMSEKIFAHQNELNEKNYRVWAKEIGLNMEKFEKDLKDNDQKYSQVIERDMKVGAENAKLEGTPWILLNGWLLDGDISVASVKKMIEAKALIK